MEVSEILADAQLEAVVIGAALTAPDVAEELCERLVPEDFADPRYREAWRAINATLRQGQCDIITVATTVDQARCPGLTRMALAEMVANCPSVELGLQAVARLKNLRERRELHEVGLRLATAAADRSQEPDACSAEAIRALAEVTRVRSGAITAAEALPEAMAYLQRLRDGDPGASGLPTGFAKLDRYLQLRPGELTVVGARPSVGKSAFLLCVALNAARQGKPVLLASCEMSSRELVLRALPAFSGIAVSDIREGAVARAVWTRVEEAEREVSRLPLRIYDRGRCRVADVARESRAMQRKEGLALVCVDYLGLLTPVRTPPNRTKENEIAEISADLKAAAMQLRVPLLVAAQLNREAESRKPDLPTLRHLRDSGAIEQDADNVLLLHRDRDADKATVIVAKQRNGQAGIAIALPFNPKLTRFSDVPEADDPGALIRTQTDSDGL